MIPGLVRDEDGEDVDYTARVSMEDEERILTITPDLPEDDATGISLWLKPEDAEQWISQDVSTVRYRRNGAVLEIKLASVLFDWFGPDAEDGTSDFFEFTLDPGEDGTRVEVNAVLDDQQILAETLSCITLKLNETMINVTENGMYPIG